MPPYEMIMDKLKCIDNCKDISCPCVLPTKPFSNNPYLECSSKLPFNCCIKYWEQLTYEEQQRAKYIYEEMFGRK